ncbi:MAG: 3'(2'),5'-bisphosphate nucleotidase CysQ [Pseudomonadota bacterium]
MQPPSLLLTDADHRAMAGALLPVTRAAGRIIMSYFGTDPDVDRKGDDSPVTRADREAEEAIVEALAEIAPGVPVVGEELASRGDAPDVGATFFLVDPLDGTRGFIKGRTEFTVNIGLVADGQPVFGIVYRPATSELFMSLGTSEAVEALLACGSDSLALPLRLDALDLRPIAPRPLNRDALVAVGSRYISKRLQERLDQVDAGQVHANSSVKFCMIARGDGDFYPRYGRISEWDTAAGAAVLSAAGGCTTGLDGRPLVYGKSTAGFPNEAFIAWSTPEPPADLLALLGQG